MLQHVLISLCLLYGHVLRMYGLVYAYVHRNILLSVLAFSFALWRRQPVLWPLMVSCSRYVCAYSLQGS